MLYPRILFLALFVIAGCKSSDLRYPITQKHISDVKEALITAAVHIDGGTGFAIKQSNGFTYFLTAGHVTDGETVVMVTNYYDGKFQTRTGFVVSRSIRYDLSIVMVSGTDYTLLKISSDESYLTRKEGDIVLAAGWPRTRPAMISIGSIRNPMYREGPRGPWLYHSASGWFGYSGGPVVLLSTGEVIGVTVEIRGEPGLWDSSLMISIPAVSINDFIRNSMKEA